jgi:hypothetical protein
MGYNSTYTVEDLMGALSEMDPLAPVMVAIQPMWWPLEHSITGIVSDCNGIVYLAASEECKYLSEEAKEAFEVAGIPFQADR